MLYRDAEFGPVMQGKHNIALSSLLIEIINSPCITGPNSACLHHVLNHVTHP